MVSIGLGPLPEAGVKQRNSIEDLHAAGFLLPPVLTPDDIQKALHLESTEAVLRLRETDGLPLARVGQRYVVTRQAFNSWIDAKTRESQSRTSDVHFLDNEELLRTVTPEVTARDAHRHDE